ncbi:MAG TPA: carbon monoxide dehydrogenase subunit G [Vicinamibacterales bacterium]|nr:carbon monoxide dehydrogenase subunit G [Vicinamibacterales bacterium]
MNLQYSGEEKIAASPATVWAFVQDPEKVGRCLPDVVDVAVQDPKHVDAVVQVAVGPVRGKFKLKLELMPDPLGRRIDMKVSGGGFGSAVDLTAGADVIDAGNGTTLLKWSGQAVARGPVAVIGGRVLDAQAKKLIEQAFANVRQQLST